MTLEEPAQPDHSRLRISYLFPQFPVASQAFAISDILALRALGHTVTVYTIKAAGAHEAELLKSGHVPDDLAVRRPSLRGALRWPALIWRMRQSAAKLIGQILNRAAKAPVTAITALLCLPRALEIVTEINQSDADVVHAFWSRHPGMVLSLLHHQGAPPLRSTFVGAYDLVADDFLVDLALESAEITFTHAEANRPYMMSKLSPGRPLEIILRGIPLMDGELGNTRDGSLWLTASALTPVKNVEGVLRAFAAANRAQPDLRLEIYGDGPDRSRLEQIARSLDCADSVHFGGHIGREELFKRMQRAAGFMLLSRKPSERLPNVIKEALWAGCAIITSRSEGIEELLPDPRYGQIVDADDNAAINAAVTVAIREGEPAAQQRRKLARALIAGRFSNEQSMAAYVAAWQAARVSGLPCAGQAQTRPGEKVLV